jgi:hypothetical protein
MTKAIGVRRMGARTKLTPAQRAEDGEGPLSKHWRTYFLQKLAETSNVKASAEYAGVATSRVYKARREHAGFAQAWRAALSEGYQHLEMEVLGYLRGTATDRKIDVANALRLLAAHRATVAQQRAASDECDEQQVLDSIDAMIDEMRRRTIANTTLLAAPDPGNSEDRADAEVHG